MIFKRLVHVLLGLAVAAVTREAGGQKPTMGGSTLPPTGALQYRYLGPHGNRVTAVAGVAGNPRIYYVGAASGGVFKTVDAGVHWTPIFDQQSALSIGALAVTPSNPDVVWAGTGEAFLRSNVSIGNGIYRSTNGGQSWVHMGLDSTGRIARIVVHPYNPDIVWVAALGHTYGPQRERGIFKTTDGGKTWRLVLFVDENTGASDIAIDPSDPNVLYAGMWQVYTTTWDLNSGGPGSGLYVSHDGGETWIRLEGRGLPRSPMGKIGIAIAPNRPQRVYALIETHDGGVWRSDDRGETWALINQSHQLAETWSYFTRMAVEPDNSDELYFISVLLNVSRDGGRTVSRVMQADNHDMWIDPIDGDRMIVGSDIGVSISVTRGRSWMTRSLPIAQMYYVRVDDAIPYNLYGTRLDEASFMGPSNSLLPSGSIPMGAWSGVGGCEGGHVEPDLADSVVWSGCIAGRLDLHDLRGRHTRNVSPDPRDLLGQPASAVKYRFTLSFPILVSPHDHRTVYVGSQYVHRTTNGGQRWEVISPDLTSNDPTIQHSSEGLTPSNSSATWAPSIFALAESPLEKGVLWAGTNDGRVQISRDGGRHWTDVTANITGLPPLGTVSNIEPSHHRLGTCYISVDFHQMNNRDPFIYKTTDYGQTWRKIVNGIPRSVLSYVHVVREDPERADLLYAGTENGLYVSLDGGEIWQPFQNNLPRAPVSWIEIQERFNDLVVATFGRGFYVLDDITPLRQWNATVAGSDAWLFEPRSAYRFQSKSSVASARDDPAAGVNPTRGVSINYYLRRAEQDVRIILRDSSGAVIRTMNGTGQAGMNRVWWDFRYDALPELRVRGTPLGHPHVPIESDSLRRPVPLGLWAVGVAPRVPPGRYTVNLSVNGHDVSTRSLTVLKDPHTRGSEQDIMAQTKLLLQLRQDLSEVIGLVRRIEDVRKGVDEAIQRDAGNGIPKTLSTTVRKLGVELLALEEELVQLRWADGVSEPVRRPGKLYWSIGNLASMIESSSDDPPTDQMVEVRRGYRNAIDTIRARTNALILNGLPSLNAFRERLGLRRLPASSAQ